MEIAPRSMLERECIHVIIYIFVGAEQWKHGRPRMEPQNNELGAKPRAWIITVGNELLIGRIVNTNASWLASRLTSIGFTVERIVVVPDDVEEIAEEVSRALRRAEIVITTGGLGPTYDDRTLEGIARALNRKLVLNREALELVEKFYRSKGLELTEKRVKMAYMPEGAKPVENPVGAAPGSLIDTGRGVVIALPGVPKEMQAMYEVLESYLRERAPRVSIVECKSIIAGVPESALATIIDNIAKAARNSYIKSHPRGRELENPVIEVRVMTTARDKAGALKEASETMDRILEGAEKLGGEIREKACD